jgi:hypothetical protein
MDSRHFLLDVLHISCTNILLGKSKSNERCHFTATSMTLKLITQVISRISTTSGKFVSYDFLVYLLKLV